MSSSSTCIRRTIPQAGSERSRRRYRLAPDRRRPVARRGGSGPALLPPARAGRTPPRSPARSADPFVWSPLTLFPFSARLRLSGVVCGLKGVPAPGRGHGVGIADGEPRGGDRRDVVDLGAAQESRTRLIDKQANAAFLNDLIVRLG